MAETAPLWTPTQEQIASAPMTAFMVAAWSCHARVRESAGWAWGAAAFAFLAYFTKAAAAFFVTQPVPPATATSSAPAVLGAAMTTPSPSGSVAPRRATL